MASTIQVDIVSAEEQIFSGEAYMVYAPAVMGEVGIACLLYTSDAADDSALV